MVRTATGARDDVIDRHVAEREQDEAPGAVPLLLAVERVPRIGVQQLRRVLAAAAFGIGWGRARPIAGRYSAMSGSGERWRRGADRCVAVAEGPDGTVPLTVHVESVVRMQIKILAAEDGTTVHALVREGLNAVFARHHHP